jgi:4-amino-4-deoxy-L-arabinose transferase-like glycosyltransferase
MTTVLSGRAGVAMCLTAMALACVLFASRFLGDPLMGDEIYFVLAADNVARESGLIVPRPFEAEAWIPAPGPAGSVPAERAPAHALWHPPAYVYMLAAVFKAAGTGAAAARMAGLLCFVVTLVAIHALCRCLYRARPDRDRIGVVACLLFAVSPMAIQGSLVVDIDNTLLAPALTLCLLALAHVLQAGTARAEAAAGALFALLLWIKLATPLALLAATIVVLLAMRGRAGVPAACRIAVVGVGGFLATWLPYAWYRALPGSAPLRHLAGSFVNMQPPAALTAGLLDIGMAAARLALWASPLLLVLWAVAIARRTATLASGVTVDGLDLVRLLSVVLVVGYLYVGRTTFGFPRYHYPVLPALAVIVAPEVVAAAAGARRRLGRLALAAAVACALLVLAGDPLLSTYTALRERLVAGTPLRDVVSRAAMQAAALVAAPLLIAWALPAGMSARARVTVALAGAGLVYCVALNALQARADYLVRYAYGARGTREVMALLGRLPPTTLVFAPGEILYGAGNRGSDYPSGSVWVSEPALARGLVGTPVRAFVYGLPTNTVAAVRALDRSPTVASLRGRGWEQRGIGSYTVWLRGE